MPQNVITKGLIKYLIQDTTSLDTLLAHYPKLTDNLPHPIWIGLGKILKKASLSFSLLERKTLLRDAKYILFQANLNALSTLTPQIGDNIVWTKTIAVYDRGCAFSLVVDGRKMTFGLSGSRFAQKETSYFDPVSGKIIVLARIRQDPLDGWVVGHKKYGWVKVGNLPCFQGYRVI